MFKELDIKNVKFKKKDINYKLQKLEQNRYERQDSRFELFYENIAQAITSLEQPKIKRELLSG